VSGVYVGALSTDHSGVMTTTAPAYVGDILYDSCGGNETRYALFIDSATLTVTLVDTVALTYATVSGISVPTGNQAYAVPFTEGAGFLVLDQDWSGSACVSALQRYTITPAGVATAVGPRMVGPSVAAPDGYEAVTMHDVWDDGGYTAMGLSRWHTAAQTEDYELMIFNNIDATPSMEYTLSTDVPWTSSAQVEPNSITFSRIDGGFTVTFPGLPNPNLGPAGSKWIAYYRRKVLPYPNDSYYPNVLISDSYIDYPVMLARADLGVEMLRITNASRGPDLQAAEKLVLSVAIEGSTVPGDVMFQPWIGNAGDPAPLNPDYQVTLFAGLLLAPPDPTFRASFGVAKVYVQAALAMNPLVATPLTPTLMALHGSPTVEPYYVRNGLPVAHSDLGVDARITATLGTFAVGSAWPAPISIDLGADYRWLPDDAHYTAGTWSSSVGTHSLGPTGAENADILTDRGYIRGDVLINAPVMKLGPDESFRSDGLDWNALTVMIVAVMNTPDENYYGVLGSGNADNAAHSGTPYVDLRYTSSGQLITVSRTELASFQTVTGIVRAGQPIIMGLSLDGAAKTVTTVLCDRNPAYQVDHLTGTHPGTATLYIGNIPGDEAVGANMDLLDVLVWNRALNGDELDTAVHLLDKIYGVTIA
jgi:hypothetical protein